ncbi:protein late bloomer-like [Musca domestica]|uniref:Protein late bloomer-like n=1 Tax=Musca domestica TaxID=7370 RepID=A0ABM3US53_MUSDO|nr:protein late bloomer-like [Musca domestica]
MGCGESTLKFTLFVLNILCFILGVLTLSACIFALIEFEFSEAVKIPCIVSSVLSCILFLTSTLGCCGAQKKSAKATWAYSIIMLLLMAAQIAVIFVQPINFNNFSTEVIDKAWNVTDIKKDYLMTSYEIKYECCGKFGPSDYTDLNVTIPLSCYRNHNNRIDTNLLDVGCIDKLNAMFSSNQRIEEISDWTLAGLEGVSALVGGMLAITLQNIERRKYYH